MASSDRTKPKGHPSAAGAALSDRSGRPSLAAGPAVRRKVQKAEDKYNQDYVQLEGGVDTRWGGRDPKSNRFPVRLAPRDEMDTYMSTKANLLGKTSVSGVAYNEKADVTDADVQYAQSKADTMQYANKKSWEMNYIDWRDPYQREWLTRLKPEILQEQEKIIDDRAALETRLAKIRLRGVQSAEDLDLMYMISANVVELPEGPLWEPGMWSSRAKRGEILNRGLFNPQKYRAAALTEGATNMWDPLQAAQARIGGTGPQLGSRAGVAGSVWGYNA